MPPPSIGGQTSTLRGRRIPKGSRWAKAYNNVIPHADSAVGVDPTGVVVLLDDQGNELLGTERNATNFYDTRIWSGSPCIIEDVRGQTRILEAYTATLLLCAATAPVTILNSTFTATVNSELNGHYGLPTITAENTFAKEFDTSEKFLAVWDEQRDVWIAVKVGESEGGDEVLVRFQLTENKPIADLSAAAVILDQALVSTGVPIVVKDRVGEWAGLIGYQGIAFRGDNVAGEYDIVFLEGIARWVRCTLNAALNNGGPVSATVDDYWGGPHHAKNPGSTIDVRDRFGKWWWLRSGEKVLAVYDERDNEYQIVWGELEADVFAVDLVQDGGSAGINGLSGGGADCTITYTVRNAVTNSLLGNTISPRHPRPDNTQMIAATAGLAHWEDGPGTGTGIDPIIILDHAFEVPTPRLDITLVNRVVCNPSVGIDVYTKQIYLPVGTRADSEVLTTTLLCVGGEGGTDVTAGCGLVESPENTLSVNPDALAGRGLIPSPETDDCLIDVNVGCGIEIVSDKVQVKFADLAGDGIKVHTFLIPPGTCLETLELDLGCGLEYDAGITPNKKVKVNSTLLAGDGLTTQVVGANNCYLQIHRGCGLKFSADASPDKTLDVDNVALAQEGLVTSGACGLAVGQGCNILVTPNAVGVNVPSLAGSGLKPSIADGFGCQALDINFGCGLTVEADLLKVLYGDGLTCINGVLHALPTVYTGSCGINVVGTVISVKNTDLALSGLVIEGACGIGVGQGCGIEVTANAVSVKRTELIGRGLIIGSGTCDIDVKLGACGVKFDGTNGLIVDNVALALAGLIPSGICGLAVGAGNGITVAADTVSVNKGCGLKFTGTVLEVDTGVASTTGLICASGVVSIDKVAVTSCISSKITSCSLDLDVGAEVLRLTINYVNQTYDKNAAGIPIACSEGSPTSCTDSVGLEECIGDGGTGGTTYTAGCGIDITGTVISVVAATLAGTGLKVSSGCTLAINLDTTCGLEFSGDFLRVKASDIKGSGLISSGTCSLSVGAGDGISVSTNSVAVNKGCGLKFTSGVLEVDSAALALNGLITSGSCGIAVGQGCHILVTADAVAVNVATLAGKGLTEGAGTGCTQIDLNLGCGLEFSGDTVRAKVDGTTVICNASGQLQSIAGSPGAGCGISVVGNTVSVNASTLAQAGLITSGTCGLAVGPGDGIAVDSDAVRVLKGCGLKFTSGVLEVDGSALAGNGLILASGTGSCALDIGQGCHILVTTNAIAVNVATLAGAGIKESTGTGGCTQLELNLGCGLEFSGDTVRAKVDGVTVLCNASGQLEAVGGGGGSPPIAGCGINVVGNTVSVNATTLAQGGLVVIGTCGIRVGAGCGITIGTNDVSVDRAQLLGRGLTAGAGTGTCNIDLDLGCGLEFSSNKVQVKVGPGITCNTITGAIEATGTTLNAGCGISISGGFVSVNASILAAGSGSNSGLVTAGSCGLQVNVDTCALEIVGNLVKVKPSGLAGSGLITEGSCGLAIGQGCHTLVTTNAIAVNVATLAGKGLVEGAGTGCTQLDLNLGCGLEFSGDTVRAKVDNTTIICNGSGQLQAIGGGGGSPPVAGCGISVSGSTVSVDIAQLIGKGLTTGVGTGACDIDLNLGCGLEFNGTQVRVKVGSGITCNVTTGAIEATGTTLTPGCGITISSGIISVNTGVNSTTGLICTSGTVSIDKTPSTFCLGSKITGCSLDLDAALEVLRLTINYQDFTIQKNAAGIPITCTTGTATSCIDTVGLEECIGGGGGGGGSDTKFVFGEDNGIIHNNTSVDNAAAIVAALNFASGKSGQSNIGEVILQAGSIRVTTTPTIDFHVGMKMTGRGRTVAKDGPRSWGGWSSPQSITGTSIYYDGVTNNAPGQAVIKFGNTRNFKLADLDIHLSASPTSNHRLIGILYDTNVAPGPGENKIIDVGIVAPSIPGIHPNSIGIQFGTITGGSQTNIDTPICNSIDFRGIDECVRVMHEQGLVWRFSDISFHTCNTGFHFVSDGSANASNGGQLFLDRFHFASETPGSDFTLVKVDSGGFNQGQYAVSNGYFDRIASDMQVTCFDFRTAQNVCVGCADSVYTRNLTGTPDWSSNGKAFFELSYRNIVTMTGGGIYLQPIVRWHSGNSGGRPVCTLRGTTISNIAFYSIPRQMVTSIGDFNGELYLDKCISSVHVQGQPGNATDCQTVTGSVGVYPVAGNRYSHYDVQAIQSNAGLQVPTYDGIDTIQTFTNSWIRSIYNPSGHWKFNDALGATTALASTGNNLTIDAAMMELGAPIPWLETCCNFEKSVANAGRDTGLNISPSATSLILTGFVRAGTFVNTVKMFAIASGGTLRYQFGRMTSEGSGGDAGMIQMNHGGVSSFTGGKLERGTWHHFIFFASGSTLTLWLDGRRNFQNFSSGWNSALSGNLFIGGDSLGKGNYTFSRVSAITGVSISDIQASEIFRSATFIRERQSVRRV